MAVIGEIFISHTHADAEIAHALSDAIAGIFKDLLTTSYSTKKELEGGIKPGEEWFRWIVDHVRSADIAVILMTPSSTQKPWVLWEAGAVYGAGIASAEGNARKVRPLLFKPPTLRRHPGRRWRRALGHREIHAGLAQDVRTSDDGGAVDGGGPQAHADDR
jgi:hypothetical protein